MSLSSKSATASSSMMHKTRIDLPLERREAIVALLQDRLIETIDLGLQIKQAHWNVKGPHFIELHKLFDEFYDEVEEYVDLTAERITALGGTALGTIQAVSGRSRLPSYPLMIVDGMAHVDALATSFAAFGKATREAIDRSNDLGDADTADIFTEVSRGIDKDLWFLEAHLQGGK
jgi:starvation-inducible DNA-binding protein